MITHFSIVNSQFSLLPSIGYPQMRKASPPLQHPSTPMLAGTKGIREFTIIKSAQPVCPLLRRYYVEEKFVTYAAAYATKYKVMKTKDTRGRGGKDLIFYVIQGPGHFIKIYKDDETLEQDLAMYKGQVGYAKCAPGRVVKIEVIKDARRCGIATVLTELCFLDPDIYRKPERRIYRSAYDILEEHGVETHCKKAVALSMHADPMIGAYTYFSAALRSGYNKLVVNWPSVDFDKISVYDTHEAKKSYDPKTGIIDPLMCCNNEKKCNAYKSDWVFCDE